MRGLHCLYRHYDAEGALLYIGISSSLAHRIEAHRRASDWFPLVVSISVQHFDTREALEEAERAAIVAEKPPHNRRVDGAPHVVKPQRGRWVALNPDSDALRKLKELAEADKQRRKLARA